MDASKHQTEKVIEDLVSVTFQLLAASRAGDAEEIQKCATRREAILKKMTNIFKKLYSGFGAMKESWRDRLAQVHQMDIEVEELIRMQSSRTQKELRSLHVTKLNFLDQNQVNPRGSKLEIQG